MCAQTFPEGKAGRQRVIYTLMEPLRGEPGRVVSNHVNDHSLHVTLPSHSDVGSRIAPPSQLPGLFPGRVRRSHHSERPQRAHGRWVQDGIFLTRVHNLIAFFSHKGQRIGLHVHQETSSLLPFCTHRVRPGSLPHHHFWEQRGCRRT